MAGTVHREASETDELRALLLFGTRSPLSRVLAGLAPGASAEAVGKERPSHAAPAGDFFTRLAEASRSRGTIGSRLACLALTASTGRLHQLQLGLLSLSADGVAPPILRHLEIEALRQGGQFQQAFRLSVQVDAHDDGEMTVHRVRQLAAVCREWPLPGMALPALREWLGRFPDSPGSALVWLDRCLNSLALAPRPARRGSPLVRRSARAAWRLGLARRDRAMAAGEPGFGSGGVMTAANAAAPCVVGDAPWSAIAAQLGSIVGVTPLGQGRSTFIVHGGGRQAVAKRMPRDRPPDQYRELFEQLAALPSRPCPRLLGTTEADGLGWYALFEWVEGTPPSLAPGGDESMWRATLELLRTLSGCGVTPDWRIDREWLDRLERGLADDGAACSVLRWLRRAQPEGPSSLAHGDFSPQNLVRRPGGLVLVDWEEVGSAAAGFDAGWMLAHATMGAGPRGRVQVLAAFHDLGLPDENLVWFETLGLLRLLFRVRTLGMDDGTRRIVTSVLRSAIGLHAATLGIEQ